jgi:hypothetical protein
MAYNWVRRSTPGRGVVHLIKSVADRSSVARKNQAFA